VLKDVKNPLKVTVNQKVDMALLKEMLDSGKTKSECARYFKVSPAAVTQIVKRYGLKQAAIATLERADKILGKGINAVEQLQTINRHANEILDLLMRWNRGEDEALQILEGQVRKVRVGKGEDAEEITQYHFKDPRELALRAMGEIRGQLQLQLEIFRTLYDMEAVAEFQKAVLEAIGEVSPDVRATIIENLKQRRALRRSVDLT
jgi:hypothetical protein